jgi:hypothetical protein
MRWLPTFLWGLVAIALCAPTAFAQDDAAGLYEPFPSKARTKRAKNFVKRLPVTEGKLEKRLEVSGRELGQGRLVRTRGLEPFRSPVPGPATARAGIADGTSPGLPTALALAALAAALGAAGLAWRRST